VEAPLVVFDTNVLVDMWLRRDGDHALLLLDLAEGGKVHLAVPEFVLTEFRGTAMRMVTEIHQRKNEARSVANEWSRSTGLDLAAEDLRKGADKASLPRTDS
jgi:predicted nucleic acid-binding protein